MVRINGQSKYSTIYRSRACSTEPPGVASGGVRNERVCPRHEAIAYFTAARDIWFSRAGVVYPTGNDGMYHRPEKCVRDAHAKDARDRVSGMHECSNSSPVIARYVSQRLPVSNSLYVSRI